MVHLHTTIAMLMKKWGRGAFISRDVHHWIDFTNSQYEIKATYSIWFRKLIDNICLSRSLNKCYFVDCLIEIKVCGVVHFCPKVTRAGSKINCEGGRRQ